MQPVIKWTGSKRYIAKDIVLHIPNDINMIVEPFLGGGSVMYYYSHMNCTKICMDINKDLINIWRLIQYKPGYLIQYYSQMWEKFLEGGKIFYNEIRDKYNTKTDTVLRAVYLFFLTRTCVNGLIRYNKKGKFNTSCHFNRNVTQVKRMSRIIYDWHNRIKDNCFIATDYKNIDLKELGTDSITNNVLFYLDPPYYNTKGQYYNNFNNNEFIEFLEKLNTLGFKYILSYDGYRDNELQYKLPDKLYKRSFVMKTSLSSFNNLRKEKVNVQEMLYLNY